MFKPLHALAQKATLMIVITAEGPELLRVNITPVQPNDKTKAHELRPLSLLASPEELDADFAGAVEIWHAPKRSVLDQARAVAGDDEGTGGTSGKAREPKAGAKKPSKPARGTTEQKSGDETPAAEAGTAAAAVIGDDAQAGQGIAPAGSADSESAAGATLSTGLAEAAATLTEIAPPAAEAAKADDFTLDLF